MPGLLNNDWNALAALLSQDQQPRPAGLLGNGLAPYGFRHEESVYAPATAKGKGYFGLLPHADGGMSTEISAHDSMNRGFPLLVPTLTAQELEALLSGGDPTEEIYRKAAAYAESRRQSGLSPFSQPNELRYPQPK